MLKAIIIQRIKEDPLLFGKVAASLNLAPTSLIRILAANHPKLTQVNVLQTIREHLKNAGEKQSISDLIEKQVPAA